MTKSRIFLFVLLCFIVGVFARSFFEINENLFFLLLIFSAIELFIFYKSKTAIMLAVFVFAFLFGVWKTDEKIKITENLVFAGNFIEKESVVEKVTPSAFGQNVIVYFSDEKIYVLLQTPEYPQYSYGDLLEISCTLKPIENLPTGQVGRDAAFDYRMYMAKEGVFYQCDKSKVNKIGEHQANKAYSAVLSLKQKLEKNILKVISQPYGSLANGLLFGGNNGLSKDIQNDFSRTGMTHIVAVSGYNVTIIAEYLILLGITLGLWRNQAIWFALIGIVLFVVMIGLPSSAVRAGVMSGILLWAMKKGRLANSQNAIIFACSIMLFINPLLFRWDIGFQLSFLATLGIVASASFWDKSLIKKHKALGITEIITLSLSAQIFVLPIIAYNFHTASLISLLANVFILPIIPFSMLMVFLVCVFGFIYGPLSLVFAWFAFLPLFYEIKLIHILSEFPWANVAFQNVSVYFVVTYYILLIVILIWNKKRQEKKYLIKDDEK